jgi:RHS repeat-associated protein
MVAVRPGQLDSSSLGGLLIGTFDGPNTTFFMTDGLGSVVASFSNTEGLAAVLGNQTYEPYGKARYQQGNRGTSKGYTDQYNDNLSGLDYYGARYYDPVAGVFLSPDRVQGNDSGMNPYAYVAGNPETLTDPTGQAVCAPDAPPNIDPCTTTTAGSTAAATAAATLSAAAIAAAVAAAFLIASSIAILITGWNYNVQQGWNSVHSTYYPKNGPDVQPAPTPTNPVVPPSYGSDPFVNNRDMPDDISTTVGLSLAPQPAPGGSGGSLPPYTPVASPSSPCSFTPDTQVTTNHGKEAIGDLQVGDKVMAYNPKTHQMEAEPVLHVWKHVDSDLIDLTITIETPAHDGKPATKQSEVIHTTSEHPFLTEEQGFVPAGQLKVGMHVQRADGSFGIVSGWKTVTATRTMYNNLEVQQDHPFAVGDGEWVVHNQCRSDTLATNITAATGITKQPGQNPHHIITCDAYNRNHPLIVAAGGLFDINAAYNGRFMWNRANARRAMQAKTPYHANNPTYEAMVWDMLTDAWNNLGPIGQTSAGQAYTALREVINRLNNYIDTLGQISFLLGRPCSLDGTFI